MPNVCNPGFEGLGKRKARSGGLSCLIHRQDCRCDIYCREGSDEVLIDRVKLSYQHLRVHQDLRVWRKKVQSASCVLVVAESNYRDLLKRRRRRTCICDEAHQPVSRSRIYNLRIVNSSTTSRMACTQKKAKSEARPRVRQSHRAVAGLRV